VLFAGGFSHRLERNFAFLPLRSGSPFLTRFVFILLLHKYPLVLRKVSGLYIAHNTLGISRNEDIIMELAKGVLLIFLFSLVPILSGVYNVFQPFCQRVVRLGRFSSISYRLKRNLSSRLISVMVCAFVRKGLLLSLASGRTRRETSH
jgi:hypothetical protein